VQHGRRIPQCCGIDATCFHSLQLPSTILGEWRQRLRMIRYFSAQITRQRMWADWNAQTPAAPYVNKVVSLTIKFDFLAHICSRR
jgi:hypothetical protein